MLSQTDVLVIVPAFNEAATIGDVVLDIRDAGFSVLVVSDGSTDQTVSVASAARATVLRLAINVGVGGALRAGFRYAVDKGFKAIVQVDGDGQHPVGAIRDLVAEANRSHSDLVIGSRFLATRLLMEIGLTRRIAMRILSQSASGAAGVRITDATSGFRLIAEPLLSAFAESFPDYYLGDTFEALVSAGRAGYRVTEIPASLTPRAAGRSTATPVQAAKFTIKSLCLVLLRTHFPLRRPAR